MAQDQIYKIVTERICDLLEAGVNPWTKPWNSTGPRSIHGHPYRGFNAFALALTNYKSPFWVTFKECKKRGGYVKKGEKSTPIVFWKLIDRKNPKKGESKKIPLARYFRVFNIEQTEGMKDIPEDKSQALTDFQKIEKAEEIIEGYLNGDNAPTFDYGGSTACYMPKKDHVQMPPRESFKRETAFYSVIFHELVHSTGAKNRLNRPGVANFDAFASHKYSKEELVAEMGAAFLNAICGIEAEENNNAAYLQSWLKTIKGEPKMVVQAAQAAQKAADLLQGIKHDWDKAEEEAEETAATAA